MVGQNWKNLFKKYEFQFTNTFSLDNKIPFSSWNCFYLGIANLCVHKNKIFKTCSLSTLCKNYRTGIFCWVRRDLTLAVWRTIGGHFGNLHPRTCRSSVCHHQRFGWFVHRLGSCAGFRTTQFLLAVVVRHCTKEHKKISVQAISVCL